MKTVRVITTCILFAFLATIVGGCCGGSGKETVVIEQKTAPEASVGDELLKLQEARDRGALNDEEFEAAKKKLLEKK